MSAKTIVSSTSRKNDLGRWLRRTFSRVELPPRQILMIMGAQRSGTTLFSRIFDDLFYVDVFGEFSHLSSRDKYQLRLNPPDEVNATLEKSGASLIVMKPLVESQKAAFWLQKIPNSTVVWLYRNHRDVASSSVLKFGDIEGGISQARAFVDQQFAEKDFALWKSENASAETIQFIKEFYQENMSPCDAAALFWYGRNALFLEQELGNRSDVILLKYEEFVRHPFLTISYILDQLGINQLESKTLSSVDDSSVGKGNEVKISAAIDQRCQSLMRNLDDIFYQTPLGLMLGALNQCSR